MPGSNLPGTAASYLVCNLRADPDGIFFAGSGVNVQDFFAARHPEVTNCHGQNPAM